MYKLIILGLLFIGVSCKEPPQQKTGIIPQPNVIDYQQGSFLINDKTVIVVDNSEDGQTVANGLVSFLKLNFNLSVQIVSTTTNENAIQLMV